MSCRASRLAEVHNIAVVEMISLLAESGNIIGHAASTFRILVRKVGSMQITIMIDSPYIAYDQTRFAITDAGDVEEHKNSTLEW